MFSPMDWKSTTLISGAGLLATWVFSMPNATAPAASPSAAVQAPQATASAIDIQREAARLQVRLHPESLGSVTARNPFRFASRPPREVTPVAASPDGASAAIAIPPAPQPQLSLDGVATEMVDGQEQRTAILHTDDGVVLAKEGDLVSGQYRVMTVSPATAELTDVTSGSVVRLSLR
jgi:hypothetical protein